MLFSLKIPIEAGLLPEFGRDAWGVGVVLLLLLLLLSTINVEAFHCISLSPFQPEAEVSLVVEVPKANVFGT